MLGGVTRHMLPHLPGVPPPPPPCKQALRRKIVKAFPLIKNVKLTESKMGPLWGWPSSTDKSNTHYYANYTTLPIVRNSPIYYEARPEISNIT